MIVLDSTETVMAKSSF